MGGRGMSGRCMGGKEMGGKGMGGKEVGGKGMGGKGMGGKVGVWQLGEDGSVTRGNTWAQAPWGTNATLVRNLCDTCATLVKHL